MCVCVCVSSSPLEKSAFLRGEFHLSVPVWAKYVDVCYVNVKAVELSGMDLMKMHQGEMFQTFLPLRTHIQ